MNYTTQEQNDLIDIDGTHLVGTMHTDYFTLRNIFGEPVRSESSYDKVQVEWLIQFDDGVVATIYDWKEYENPAELVTDWHIGGRDPEVALRVKSILWSMK